MAYDFHPQVIEPDERAVLRSFKYIQGQVAAELKLLAKKHGYQQIHFIGLSLGNVPLTLVADKFRTFTSATIVSGGDDLAVDLWHGLRTLDLRDDFKDEHISLSGLDEEWQSLAPDNHVKPFAHKKIYFFMSLKDKFILTKYQKRLAAAMIDVEADVVVKKRRLGHVMSITPFCLAGSPF